MLYANIHCLQKHNLNKVWDRKGENKSWMR